MTPPSQARAAAGAHIIRGKARRDRQNSTGQLLLWRTARGRALLCTTSIHLSSLLQLLPSKYFNIFTACTSAHLHVPALISASSSPFIDPPLQRSRTTPHRQYQHPAAAAYQLPSPSSLPAVLARALESLNPSNLVVYVFSSFQGGVRGQFDPGKQDVEHHNAQGAPSEHRCPH